MERGTRKLKGLRGWGTVGGIFTTKRHAYGKTSVFSIFFGVIGGKIYLSKVFWIARRIRLLSWKIQ